MSKVSIYMSSYNHAIFLQEAIDSILNQTIKDFELFIVDDASTDKSWSIIQSYKDPRIHFFRNATNRNDREWMRRVIFEMATGEYIAIHHSDNVWEPEKLKNQVDFLDRHPDFGAVFTNALNIDKSGKPFKDTPNFDFNRSRYQWLNFFFFHGNVLYHPSILIRKKCYEECGFYRNGFAQMPDFDLWVRLCLKYEIHVIPEKLIRYRVQSDEMNISGDRPETRIRMQFEYLQLLDNYLKIPSYQELVKIFPTAQKYYRPEGCDIGFVLGMIALDIRDGMHKPKLFGSSVFHLFGLKLLFEAINDPDRARKINNLYGFSHKDFIALSAKYDVFSIERRTKSKIEKTALLFNRIRDVLVPQTSLRYRLLNSLCKVIVFPIKLIRHNLKKRKI